MVFQEHTETYLQNKKQIKAGDKIVRIEEESTLDMSLTDAVERLRGERGSPVNITVFRKGEKEPREFSIVRDIIKVRSVKKKIYNKDVGYIKLRSFTKTTSSQKQWTPKQKNHPPPQP